MENKFKVYAMETQACDGTYEVSIWSDGGQTATFYGTKEELLQIAKDIPKSIEEWESV